MVFHLLTVHMDEIERIRREAENQAKWDTLNKKLMLIGEYKPESIRWENMSEEMTERHIVLALKHECYRYVKLLEQHKLDLKHERMRQEDFVKNARFQIDNCIGWIGIEDYECALIKAKCLVESLELVIAQTDS